MPGSIRTILILFCAAALTALGLGSALAQTDDPLLAVVKYKKGGIPADPKATDEGVAVDYAPGRPESPGNQSGGSWAEFDTHDLAGPWTEYRLVDGAWVEWRDINLDSKGNIRKYSLVPGALDPNCLGWSEGWVSVVPLPETEPALEEEPPVDYIALLEGEVTLLLGEPPVEPTGDSVDPEGGLPYAFTYEGYFLSSDEAQGTTTGSDGLVTEFRWERHSNKGGNG